MIALKIVTISVIFLILSSCNRQYLSKNKESDIICNEKISKEDTLSIFDNIKILKPKHYFIDSLSPQEYMISKQIPLENDFDVFAIITEYNKGEDFKFAIESYEKHLIKVDKDSVISNGITLERLKKLKHKAYEIINHNGDVTLKIYIGNFTNLYEILIYRPINIKNENIVVYCQIIDIINNLHIEGYK